MDKKRIDEYFKFAKLVDEAKEFMKEVEADALAEAEKIKENSKEKTIVFEGTNGNRIEIVEAEKLDFVSPTGLMRILKENVDGFVKTDQKYSLDSKFVKLVRDVVAGNYIAVEFSNAVEDVVSRVSDTTEVKVLKKKLKGDYTRDVALLKSYEVELPEECAYLLQEAKAYSNVKTLADAYGIPVDEFISSLKNQLFVDVTLKVKAISGGTEC